MSTLKDLARIISDRYDLPQAKSEQFVSAMFDVVKEQLTHDDIVKIKGLGTFKVQNVPERNSVDVNTGEKIVIDSHDRINFTPDNSMKDSVNKPFSHFETVTLNDGVDFDDLEDDELKRPDLPVEVAMEPVADAPVETVLPKPSYNPIPAPPSATGTSQGASGTVNNSAQSPSEPIRFGEPKPEIKPITFAEPTPVTPQTADPQYTEYQSAIPQPAGYQPATPQPVGYQPATPQPAGYQPATPQPAGYQPATPQPAGYGSTSTVRQGTTSDPTHIVRRPTEPLLTPIEETRASVAEQAAAAPAPEPRQQQQDTRPVIESVSPQRNSKRKRKNSLYQFSNARIAAMAFAILFVGFVIGRVTARFSWLGSDEANQPKTVYRVIHKVVKVEPKATATVDNSLEVREAEIEEHIKKEAEAKRIAEEKAAAERAEAERLAAEQREAERLAAEKATKAKEAARKAEEAKKAAEQVRKNSSSKKAADQSYKAQNPSEQRTSTVAASKYDADPRVRLGAYRITGISQTVTVRPGQTLQSISKFYLGKGMECYVEAVNGGITEVQPGQKIRIPSVEVKKKRK